MSSGTRVPWSREEMILALALYKRSGTLRRNDPEVERLAKLTGRTPSSIVLRLGNYLGRDPESKHQGLQGGGKHVQLFFEEFKDRDAELFELEKKILEELQRSFEPEEILDISKRVEGGRSLRTHLVRERNQAVIQVAKRLFKRRNGRLYCQGCGFDFEAVYGKLGEDFIEAHHLKPIGLDEGERETSPEDLAMLCANCHRMVHQRKEPLTLDELRRIIESCRTR